MKTFDQFQNSKIFCHRGFWDKETQQNSYDSFLLAQKNRFSIETDIRAIQDNLIVSHDRPTTGEFLHFTQLISLSTQFALNIKEDGLQELVLKERDWLDSSNSFVFDGSLPDMFKYRKLGIRHALRLSEYELSLPWQSDFIWLDSFHEDWWIDNYSVLEKSRKSQIIVVSPELHGRDPRYAWDFISNERDKGRFDFSLCTDKPLEFLSWK